MPSSVRVLSITTEDVTPTEAKFRVSHVAGFDLATVDLEFTTAGLQPGVGLRPGAGLRPSGGSPIIAWRITNGPLRSGPKLAGVGAVCGLSQCGEPGARCINVVDSTIDAIIDADDISGADGDYPLSIHVLTESGAWL